MSFSVRAVSLVLRVGLVSLGIIYSEDRYILFGSRLKAKAKERNVCVF